MKIFYFLGLFFLFIVNVDHISAQSGCDPRVSLDGYVVANKITSKNLAASRTLEIKCPDAVSPIWKVLSYDVVRVPKNTDPTMTKSTGETFSAETIAQLRKTKKDDVIFFENIKLRNATGEERTVAYVLEVY